MQGSKQASADPAGEDDKDAKALEATIIKAVKAVKQAKSTRPTSSNRSIFAFQGTPRSGGSVPQTPSVHSFSKGVLPQPLQRPNSINTKTDVCSSLSEVDEVLVLQLLMVSSMAQGIHAMLYRSEAHSLQLHTGHGVHVLCMRGLTGRFDETTLHCQHQPHVGCLSELPASTRPLPTPSAPIGAHAAAVPPIAVRRSTWNSHSPAGASATSSSSKS